MTSFYGSVFIPFAIIMWLLWSKLQRPQTCDWYINIVIFLYILSGVYNNNLFSFTQLFSHIYKRLFSDIPYIDCWLLVLLAICFE